MKNRIFMYLFIFAVLILIFQFVNSRNILNEYESQLDKADAREAVYRDSIQSAENANFELMRFQLQFNDDAMTIFENEGYEVDEMEPFIKDELLSLNIYEGDDHPIVPYASMTGNKMLINEIRLLNHKWIICNYSDGKNWGELLLSYEIMREDENAQLNFTVLDYVYYRG